MSKKERSRDSSDLNHSLYKKGSTFYDAKDYRKAIISFKEALEYWPEDGEAWLALGNCYDASNKPKRAEKCFRQSLIYQTEKIRNMVLYNLGNSLYDQSLYKDAINYYSEISKSDEIYGVAMINKKRAIRRNES